MNQKFANWTMGSVFTSLHQKLYANNKNIFSEINKKFANIGSVLQIKSFMFVIKNDTWPYKKLPWLCHSTVVKQVVDMYITKS
jgi:hypothetical protein